MRITGLYPSKREEIEETQFISLSARSINTAVMYVESHFFPQKEYKFTYVYNKQIENGCR